MEFVYKQIGLEDPWLQKAAYDTIGPLYESATNGPIHLNPHPADDISALVLETLHKHKIILHTDRWNDNVGSDICTVFIINRYKLDFLHAELQWLRRPEEEKGPDDDSGPYVDDSVYYDLATGDVLFNGVFRTLDGRNKKLFDALFIAAPGSVSRKTLLGIARTGRYATEPPQSVVSEAFTNLRKICGVTAHSIELENRGGGRLNADTYPLSEQLPKYWLHFENYRLKSRKELLSPL